MKRRHFMITVAAAFAAPMAWAETFEVTLTEVEWRARLTDLQYAVLREEDTERAGTSPLDLEKRKGVFHCAGCDQPVFAS